ncbi:hypothetical protein H5410_014895 [Solanum commersonii]|uniref:Uncharacterized protein n=1 Tax=Solanum commersonii TaxID=4109 RepID=A0A9J5ZST7_SOLCO|nr:hypothetical protein H5410_014895 [Solanum commersonii]
MAIRRLAQWVRQSLGPCPCFVPQSKYQKIKDFQQLLAQNMHLRTTQVEQFKWNVSNSVTQDSIMNAQKKTQLTHGMINCALKDLICDSPVSKTQVHNTFFKCKFKHNKGTQIPSHKE